MLIRLIMFTLLYVAAWVYYNKGIASGTFHKNFDKKDLSDGIQTTAMISAAVYYILMLLFGVFLIINMHNSAILISAIFGFMVAMNSLHSSRFWEFAFKNNIMVSDREGEDSTKTAIPVFSVIAIVAWFITFFISMWYGCGGDPSEHGFLLHKSGWYRILMSLVFAMSAFVTMAMYEFNNPFVKGTNKYSESKSNENSATTVLVVIVFNIIFIFIYCMYMLFFKSVK